MDPSALQKVSEWLTWLAAAGSKIFILLFVLGAIKTIQQLDSIVGNVTNRAKKATEGAGSNIKSRRDLNAANKKGVWGTPLGAMRRRKFLRQNKSERLSGAAKHAGQHYADKYTQGDSWGSKRYANQVAGGTPLLQTLSGGRLGSAREEDLQRVLANAKFRIEQVEIEDIKAAHATIDLQNEKALLETIRSGDTSSVKRSAAIERLVQVGGMKSIEEVVNKYGKGVDGRADGNRETTETRALAGALQKDGPGYLKASDIDNIRRGKLGQVEEDPQGNRIQIASDLEEITGANLDAGVFSAAKMAPAGKPELEYASEIAKKRLAAGKGAAAANLMRAADEVLNNKNLSGSIKHNRDHITDLAARGYI